MRIGVPREIYAGEKRAGTTPEVAARLIKLGFDVVVESNAGAAAHFSDAAFEEAAHGHCRDGDEETGHRGQKSRPNAAGEVGGCDFVSQGGDLGKCFDHSPDRA